MKEEVIDLLEYVPPPEVLYLFAKYLCNLKFFFLGLVYLVVKNNFIFAILLWIQEHYRDDIEEGYFKPTICTMLVKDNLFIGGRMKGEIICKV
jgi:hypothetical protein